VARQEKSAFGSIRNERARVTPAQNYQEGRGGSERHSGEQVFDRSAIEGQSSSPKPRDSKMAMARALATAAATRGGTVIGDHFSAEEAAAGTIQIDGNQ